MGESSKKELHTRVATLQRKDSDYIGEPDPHQSSTVEEGSSKAQKQSQTSVATLQRQDSDYIGEPSPAHFASSKKGLQPRVFTLQRKDSDYIGEPNPYNESIELSTIVGSSPNIITEPLPSASPAEGSDEENIPKQGSKIPPMSARFPTKNLWRITACTLWTFSLGLSDAAPGAILPHIEAYYDIDYAITSLIWISNAIGFILVATMAHKIEPVLGKQKSLAFGTFLQVLMFSIVGSGTKFPAIVVAFFLGGCGCAINLSQMNVFFARLDKQSKYLAYLHGSYGIGATISPLIATSMVNAGVAWHFYYLFVLGTMIAHSFDLFFAFAGADVDLQPWENETTEGADEAEVKAQHKADMLSALKSHVTWLLSLFVLFYQGGEVSLGGWVVTFLLTDRHANSKSVGYVASGFWAGLTIGRLCLTRPLHKYIGCRRSVILTSSGAIVFVALCWGVRNVYAEAVMISCAGVLIGPNYPLMITYAASEGLLPRKIQVITLTIVTAFGSSGGALFPFLIGILSQGVGTYVVMPVFIALFSVMTFMWICLPNMNRKGTKTNLLQRIW